MENDSKIDSPIPPPRAALRKAILMYFGAIALSGVLFLVYLHPLAQEKFLSYRWRYAKTEEKRERIFQEILNLNISRESKLKHVAKRAEEKLVIATTLPKNVTFVAIREGDRYLDTTMLDIKWYRNLIQRDYGEGLLPTIEYLRAGQFPISKEKNDGRGVVRAILRFYPDTGLSVPLSTDQIFTLKLMFMHSSANGSPCREVVGNIIADGNDGIMGLRLAILKFCEVYKKDAAPYVPDIEDFIRKHAPYDKKDSGFLRGEGELAQAIVALGRITGNERAATDRLIDMVYQGSINASDMLKLRDFSYRADSVKIRKQMDANETVIFKIDWKF